MIRTDRHAHLEFVAQNERDRETRDETRRVLGGLNDLPTTSEGESQMEEIHLPGADRGAGKVPPIQFPRTRVNRDFDAWKRQIETRDVLIQSAAHDAHERGYRSGYLDGAHWGAIVGIVLGSVAVALLWLSWAPLQRALAAWGWA